MKELPTKSPLDKISYEDLYARWEKGNWSAMEIDFSEDREQWHGTFSEIERKAALWNYSLFFHGEDSVADNLSPYIDAAPKEEQKYFLATQQVDEARHAVFFKRFMHEVVGAGERQTSRSALEATRPELTWGFRKTFEKLDQVADELRRDRSRPEVRAGDHDVPPGRRGGARAARPALHRELPDRARAAAWVRRRDEERLARRAAPHRLRRQGAVGADRARTPSARTRSPSCSAR